MVINNMNCDFTGITGLCGAVTGRCWFVSRCRLPSRASFYRDQRLDAVTPSFSPLS